MICVNLDHQLLNLFQSFFMFLDSASTWSGLSIGNLDHTLSILHMCDMTWILLTKMCVNWHECCIIHMVGLHEEPRDTQISDWRICTQK